MSGTSRGLTASKSSAQMCMKSKSCGTNTLVMPTVMMMSPPSTRQADVMSSKNRPTP